MMVFSLVFLASVINLGMVVSQVFLRRESSMQLFLYLSIPILFLANFSWPSYLMPQWMVSISYILPSTFAIPAWLSIEQMGADIYEVAPKLYQLAIQAVVYLVLGLVLTRARDKAKIDIGDM
jgi:ABC-2 type transport system permease protein